MLNRRTIPLKALRAFESAAYHLHLGRAGEYLGVTHGAVSHQIRALEAQLQVTLFNRSHNRLELTPAGQRLYVSVREALDQIISATHELDPQEMSGLLVIACTQTIAASWAIRHICEFQQVYPNIEIHLREIQPSQEDIPREIDIAICYGRPIPDDRKIELLASPPQLPVCSPRLLSDPANITKAEQIIDFPLLHDDNEHTWQRWFSASNMAMPKNVQHMHFPNSSLALTAARLGHGIALCNSLETQESVKDGSLIQLTKLAIDLPGSYFLLTDLIEHQPLKARVFENWIKNAVG